MTGPAEHRGTVGIRPYHLFKVAFFQKVRCVFQISKSPKKIFQKTILNLKFKFPAKNTLLLLAGNLNFKLRIVFWNIFFGDLKKRIALSEKKPPLTRRKFTLCFKTAQNTDKNLHIQMNNTIHNKLGVFGRSQSC